MNDNHMITWDEGNQQSKDAFDQFSALDAYEGVSKASVFTGILLTLSQIALSDQLPQRLLRFPPRRASSNQAEAYHQDVYGCPDKVGIIRNIIDLMGDFGCQGINIVHENESVESSSNSGSRRSTAKKDLRDF